MQKRQNLDVLVNIKISSNLNRLLEERAELLGANKSQLIRSILTEDNISAAVLAGEKIGWHPKSEKGRAKTERANNIVAMYRDGQTLNEIGETLGLTRQRIQQILRVEGISAKDGGFIAKQQKRLAEKGQQKRTAHFEKWGCFEEDLADVRRIAAAMMDDGLSWYRTPIGAFMSQKASAATRGIPFNFTFWDWWKVWDSSGKWGSRGRGSGDFVMCRIGDAGAYEAGNVYIGTTADNQHEWVARKYPDSRFAVQATT